MDPGSIFRALRRRPFDGRAIAYIVVVRHLTCPYCSTIQSAMVLGLASERIEKEMFLDDNRRRVNPGFRETHLSNPLRCINCGREFYAFVGIRYSLEDGDVRIRDIDVVVKRTDEPGVKALLNWPHKGLVMREVIEYSPFRARIYESLDHFYRHNINADDAMTSSLTSKKDNEEHDKDKDKQPEDIDLEG